MSNSEVHIGNEYQINDPLFYKVGWAEMSGKGNLNDAFISVESQLSILSEKFLNEKALSAHRSDSFDLRDYLTDLQNNSDHQILEDLRLPHPLSISDNLNFLKWERENHVIRDFERLSNLIN